MRIFRTFPTHSRGVTQMELNVDNTFTLFFVAVELDAGALEGGASCALADIGIAALANSAQAPS